MLHLGIMVQDQHQKTVEMLAHYGGVNTDLEQIHLHIIDNGSRHPYRSYFFENLPWAKITVHRLESTIATENELEEYSLGLLRVLAADGDSIIITCTT